MRFLSLIAVMLLPMTAFAETNNPSELVTGAWASGNTLDACDTAPITHFMSDGVVAAFLSKDSDLHSLGVWNVEDDTLSMTHNDFPLKGDGRSNDPVKLRILDLNETQFVTENSKGHKRSRVRCDHIELTLGHDHSVHD